MGNQVYTYKFTERVPFPDVEDTLHLAVLAAESLHGRSRVRLNAFFSLDKDKRSCVIDAGNDVGRDINRIFTGYVTSEFGDGAFQVSQIEKKETARCGQK